MAKLQIEVTGYAHDAIKKIKHASIELGILDYAEKAVISGILPKDREGEFLNQCAILLEIEMGSRDYFLESDYMKICSRIKLAGVISFEMLAGVMDKIKMQSKYRSKIEKSWESIE